MYENLSEICTSTERVAYLVLWFLPLLLFPVSVILRHIQSDTLTQQGKAALAFKLESPNDHCHVGSAPPNIGEATLPTRNVTSTFAAPQLVC